MIQLRRAVGSLLLGATLAVGPAAAVGAEPPTVVLVGLPGGRVFVCEAPYLNQVRLEATLRLKPGPHDTLSLRVRLGPGDGALIHPTSAQFVPAGTVRERVSLDAGATEAIVPLTLLFVSHDNPLTLQVDLDLRVAIDAGGALTAAVVATTCAPVTG